MSSKVLVLCFLCLFAASPSFAAHVTFTLSDFTTTAVTNRVLRITSLSTPRTNSTAVVITDQRKYTTDSTGSVTASNMVAGDYRCELLGPWATTTFLIAVPDSTNTVNAVDIIASGQSDLGVNLGYTQAATDARFVGKTNSWSTGQTLTNASLFGLRIGLTNSAAAFNLLPSQYGMVVGDTSAGNVTLTLPGSSFVSDGRVYHFKNSGSNNLIIQAAGSDKIDGAASITLTNLASAELVKHGANWWKM
jgi:hypothetical protein